ncbi:uncharacterized protein LOC113147252 [Cyclospora cayetanensis]|uniref:Uncharacterized protein LOC113147252 n=1 Tax=Cyclospora cayetanensis TaxID=88456 RepID=A0A6P6RYG5_9EIME|nr:uncharacterized protein LOC113147252 [Cyclospora cayetanensis]
MEGEKLLAARAEAAAKAAAAVKRGRRRLFPSGMAHGRRRIFAYCCKETIGEACCCSACKPVALVALHAAGTGGECGAGSSSSSSSSSSKREMQGFSYDQRLEGRELTRSRYSRRAPSSSACAAAAGDAWSSQSSDAEEEDCRVDGKGKGKGKKEQAPLSSSRRFSSNGMRRAGASDSALKASRHLSPSSAAKGAADAPGAAKRLLPLEGGVHRERQSLDCPGVRQHERHEPSFDALQRAARRGDHGAARGGSLGVQRVGGESAPTARALDAVESEALERASRASPGACMRPWWL